MGETDFSSLSWPVHPMPDTVMDALIERGLLDAYRSRPTSPGESTWQTEEDLDAVRYHPVVDIRRRSVAEVGQAYLFTRYPPRACGSGGGLPSEGRQRGH